MIKIDNRFIVTLVALIVCSVATFYFGGDIEFYKYAMINGTTLCIVFISSETLVTLLQIRSATQGVEELFQSFVDEGLIVEDDAPEEVRVEGFCRTTTTADNI